jgi:hypothetical protein
MLGERGLELSVHALPGIECCSDSMRSMRSMCSMRGGFIFRNSYSVTVTVTVGSPSGTFYAWWSIFRSRGPLAKVS